MARLHEYQGKALLAGGGLGVPRGIAAATPAEAREAAVKLDCGAGKGCVVKIQAWTTGRAAIGGIVFCTTPAEVEAAAATLLAMIVGQFPISHVLVEERLEFVAELFLSISIDERERRPVLLIAAGGGSGVEERAASVQRVVCDVATGPDDGALNDAVNALPIAPAVRIGIADFARTAFTIARDCEARSLEINPLAITRDGRLIAADCRITIDDYAVGRHPELGIDFARELDHPPTELERIAYRVEQEDHRGTFFFAQMNRVANLVPRHSVPSQDDHGEQRAGSENRHTGGVGIIGFHGAGGGGSMMSMDAINAEGFTIANFCDTSGNPSPAKVYRAARIILAQPGLIGYFGSGSGVANQEQYWSAYGLAKAFWELDLDIPAVIRLGGNTEDRAADILHSACKTAGLRARVECYKKSDTPSKIAARFAELVRAVGTANAASTAGWQPRAPRKPHFVGHPSAFSFPLKNGTLWIDPTIWKSHAPAIIAHANGLLKDVGGRPALAPPLTPEAFLSKDSEMIACEVECRRDGLPSDGGFFVDLPIEGLDVGLVL